LEECCIIENEHSRPTRSGTCPESGHRGRRVRPITLQSFLNTAPHELRDERPYFFCAASDCSVVYFAEDGTQVYTKEQVQVPVFQKEPWDGVPACYCFGFTPHDIWEEIARTGRSTVADLITQGVREGKCECEITNPQGSCCLGNVQQVVQAAEGRGRGDKEKGGKGEKVKREKWE